MNRADRRRIAAKAGKPMGRLSEVERSALNLTPDEARAMLARWAAMPGRTQAEVDALNPTEFRPAVMNDR